MQTSIAIYPKTVNGMKIVQSNTEWKPPALCNDNMRYIRTLNTTKNHALQAATTEQSHEPLLSPAQSDTIDVSHEVIDRYLNSVWYLFSVLIKISSTFMRRSLYLIEPGRFRCLTESFGNRCRNDDCSRHTQGGLQSTWARPCRRNNNTLLPVEGVRDSPD